jgi:hypothetical protein
MDRMPHYIAPMMRKRRASSPEKSANVESKYSWLSLPTSQLIFIGLSLSIPVRAFALATPQRASITTEAPFLTASFAMLDLHVQSMHQK